MQAYVDAGLTTFDMADIYGPAEEIFGQFNSQVNTHKFRFQCKYIYEFLNTLYKKQMLD